MTDAEKIIWGVVASLILGCVWALPKWWRRRSDDSLKLTAKLAQSNSLELLDDVGCACLVVTVANRGRRTAKIANVQLVAMGVDAMTEIQKGFDQDFGHTPAPDGPPPEFRISLPPLSKLSQGGGWHLERDDVCKFIIPILAPGVSMMPSLPTEDVQIVVEYLTGEREVLMRGVSVTSQIEVVIASWSNRLHEQACKIRLQYEYKTTSTTPGTADAVGHVNMREVGSEMVESTNPGWSHRRRG